MSGNDERLEFVAALSRELPNHSIRSVLELAKTAMRQGATYGRLAVALCNGEIDQPEYDKRTERIEQRLNKLLGVLGIEANYGGDPRGYTVKLVFPSRRSNTFGGDGWGVPNS